MQSGRSPGSDPRGEGSSAKTSPFADNSTAAGKQQNRRVEVYLYASQQMIKNAEAQAR